MKIEITPGPWDIEGPYRNDIGGPDRWGLIGPPCNVYLDLHNEADAKAISAVPEMLEVLAEIKEQVVFAGRTKTLETKINNALRKAGVME